MDAPTLADSMWAAVARNPVGSAALVMAWLAAIGAAMPGVWAWRRVRGRKSR